MKKFLLLYIGFFVCNYVFPQDAFEGIVRYKSELKGNSPIMEGMMPDSFIFLFKDKDVRLMVVGGIISSMMGDIISKGDSNVSFMLDDIEKIAYRYDPYKYEKALSPDIEETEKTQQHLNKKCKLYKVNYATKDGYVETSVWTTNDITLAIPDNNPMSRNFVFNGVEGFPMLIESKVTYQQNEFEMIIRAVSIIKKPIPDKEFLIPPDYKIVPLVAPADIGF
jgi:hypothetical protein